MASKKRSRRIWGWVLFALILLLVGLIARYIAWQKLAGPVGRPPGMPARGESE